MIKPTEKKYDWINNIVSILFDNKKFDFWGDIRSLFDNHIV